MIEHKQFPADLLAALATKFSGEIRRGENNAPPHLWVPEFNAQCWINWDATYGTEAYKKVTVSEWYYHSDDLRDSVNANGIKPYGEKCATATVSADRDPEKAAADVYRRLCKTMLERSKKAREFLSDHRERRDHVDSARRAITSAGLTFSRYHDENRIDCRELPGVYATLSDYDASIKLDISHLGVDEFMKIINLLSSIRQDSNHT